MCDFTDVDVPNNLVEAISPHQGGILSIKTQFFEKEVFEKTVYFFYSRISVKNAVFLNIQKS
jgi:hypothetical protein